MKIQGYVRRRILLLPIRHRGTKSPTIFRNTRRAGRPQGSLAIVSPVPAQGRSIGQGPTQSNGMCLAEFSVYSNLKPCASTERIVDLPQVTSCGPGPVSLPGALISCGYFPGGLVGPM